MEHYDLSSPLSFTLATTPTAATSTMPASHETAQNIEEPANRCTFVHLVSYTRALSLIFTNIPSPSTTWVASCPVHDISSTKVALLKRINDIRARGYTIHPSSLLAATVH